MSMLLFHVGDSRYAIENSAILKVIPFVYLKSISHAPDYLTGMLNLGKGLVPVIDFCQLIEGRAAKPAMHTRIILIHNDQQALTTIPLIGLIGEQITEIIDLEKSQFKEPSFYLNDRSFLNGIYSDGQGIIQAINISELFKYFSATLSSISQGKL